eukprot:scaffold42_cov229-Chaetoceros_neogracile.AAC.3
MSDEERRLILKPSKMWEDLTFDCSKIACVSTISKASLVDSAREEVGAKASNMNARSRTKFVIVEAMLTNPSPAFFVRDEVRATRRSPTTLRLEQGIEGVRI